MGLIIKSTESKKINVQQLDGTTKEEPQVYARLEAALRPDGKSVEIAFPYIFLSKDAYKLNGPVLRTDIPTSAGGEVAEQTMELIHEAAKVALTNAGYEVEIDLPVAP